MELLIIRHAKAAEHGEHRNDAERPLVEKGERQAAMLGEFLAHPDWRPEVVLTSPLLRARQTAEGLCRAAGLPGPVVQGWLSSGLFPEQAMRELVAFADFGRVAVVGHQPDLSAWVEWLLSLESGSIEMKKGALVALRVTPPIRRAELMFMLTPKTLQAARRK